MFADPPSVDGMDGGQMGEAAPGAAAVELADCVEVSNPSPGNSRGIWELGDEVLPPAEDPLPVTPPAPDVDVENVEDDDCDVVGTLRGSNPTIVFPPAFVCAAVWAWAVVMPRRKIAVRTVRCIAFSALEIDRGAALLLAMQDNAPSVKTEDEV